MASDLFHREGEEGPPPQSESRPKPQLVKIVVPTVVIGVAMLAVAAGCVIRARKRKSAGESYFFKGFSKARVVKA